MAESQAQIMGEQRVAKGEAEVQRERDDYHHLMQGRPTPTQHECNLIKAGVPPEEKESDGGVPDPVFALVRQPEGAGGGGARPSPQPQPYRQQPTRRVPPPPPPASAE